MAIAAGLFMAAPAAPARAADGHQGAAGVADAELVAFSQRLESRREAATRLAVDVLGRALGRGADRAAEARETMERVLTWGYGFEGLAMVDPSVFEGPRDEGETAEPESSHRLEFVTDTNDPLAGL